LRTLDHFLNPVQAGVGKLAYFFTLNPFGQTGFAPVTVRTVFPFTQTIDFDFPETNLTLIVGEEKPKPYAAILIQPSFSETFFVPTVVTP
jgi:hypothetical protein